MDSLFTFCPCRNLEVTLSTFLSPIQFNSKSFRLYLQNISQTNPLLVSQLPYLVKSTFLVDYHKVVSSTQELQTGELLECSWYSEKTTWRTSRCGHADYSSHRRGAHRQWQVRGRATAPPLVWGSCYKGSQTKEARVLHVTLNYITSVCTCRKKRSRGSHSPRSHSQKEIRRELESIPQTIHISSGQEPALQPHNSLCSNKFNHF